MNQQNKELDLQISLVQLVNTRICHDLAGPMGVINNCITLLDYPGIEKKKVEELMKTQSTRLVSALRLVRTGYGNSCESKIGEVKTLVTDFCENAKVEIKIQRGIGDVESELIRVLLCLCQVIAGTGGNGKLKIIFKNKNLIEINYNGYHHLREDSPEILCKDTDKIIDINNCLEVYLQKLCKLNSYKIDLIINKEEVKCQILKNLE